MQFLNDHMGKPRVDGHFHIPSLPQGITVKAMNINLSNETGQFILEIVSVLSIATVNFFEIKRQFEHHFIFCQKKSHFGNFFLKIDEILIFRRLFKQNL